MVHTVVRQMGPDLPIYEVRPERGKGRFIVLRRNLLMSCDHSPFETQLEMTKSDKRKQGHQSALWPQECDEDSGDEYDLHYEPLPVPMPPSVTNERHTELEIESEHDSHYL